MYAPHCRNAQRLEPARAGGCPAGCCTVLSRHRKHQIHNRDQAPISKVLVKNLPNTTHIAGLFSLCFNDNILKNPLQVDYIITQNIFFMPEIIGLFQRFAALTASILFGQHLIIKLPVFPNNILPTILYHVGY